jgi:hypothetical protein
MIPGTVRAGVTMTARSGAWGRSVSRRYARLPKSSRCLGLTA